MSGPEILLPSVRSNELSSLATSSPIPEGHGHNCQSIECYSKGLVEDEDYLSLTDNQLRDFLRLNDIDPRGTNGGVATYNDMWDIIDENGFSTTEKRTVENSKGITSTSENHRGIYHNSTGPAYINKAPDGRLTTTFYINGVKHREHREGGGPAEEINYPDGTKYEALYSNGEIHNEDGPAVRVTHPNGTFNEYYYYLGVQVAEDAYTFNRYLSTLQ
jgi:hypothetical protein